MSGQRLYSGTPPYGSSGRSQINFRFGLQMDLTILWPRSASAYTAASVTSNMKRCEEMGRFGLVFEKPKGMPEQAPVTLHKTAERLHAVDWQHQGLRSANILFFEDPWICKIDYATPFVSGFHYFHPATRDDMTQRPSDDLAADLYRHPFAQDFCNQHFKKSHGIYTLGIILLEIAVWEPIDRLLGIDFGEVRPKDAYLVRDRLVNREPRFLEQVRSHQGRAIENVIAICPLGLEGSGLSKDFDESSEEGEAMLQRAFGEQVVAKLAGIRGL
ncbi:hypothetical protein BU25DRAFT_475931 [Macroventuria anomochaeta]|uniref:Uncharacterized protein n=1 Tax=Macroventuria anomochaeta TaxID=301207 RepID=A0ACB6SEH9_9PLEO|nr:uncharacterized protein BU25DRAFT_475931 [Macroventuria anomochaeta]KAF2632387.1 hypothetical protein BU25DRAFT_475931 [Macroventuria anomochaeta]